MNETRTRRDVQLPYTAACAAMRAAVGYQGRHGGRDRGSIGTRFGLPATGRILRGKREVQAVPLAKVVAWCETRQVSQEASRRWRLILRNAAGPRSFAAIPPDSGKYNPRAPRAIRAPVAHPAPPPKAHQPTQPTLPGVDVPAQIERELDRRESAQAFGVLCEIRNELKKLREQLGAADLGQDARDKRILTALTLLEKTVAIQETGTRVATAKALEALGAEINAKLAAPITFSAVAGPPPTVTAANPTPKTITTTILEF